MSASLVPMPRPGVMAIKAYMPGKSTAPAGVRLHKLSSNETPFGASPKAIAAYQQSAGSLALYPDGSSTALRQKIASLYGLDASRIVCGAGSDELLSLITNAYAGPGDEGIFTEHGFLVYRIALLAAGATPVVVKERNFTADIDAILAAVTPRTKIVFLANPNNPTGTYLPFDEVKRLHAGLRPDIVLVLDAAYAEYVRRNDYAAGIELVATSSNVVMTRTFSKSTVSRRCGLAGAMHRQAWPTRSIASAAPSTCRLRRSPLASLLWRITRISMPRVAHNDLWLGKLTEALKKLGLTVTPSVGNFVLIHFPARPSQCDSGGCLAHRAWADPACRRCLWPARLPAADHRLGGGNEAVLAALTSFMAS